MTTFIEKNLNKILESSFDMSNQAIYWLNKEGRILYANKNALDGLSYSLEEIEKLYVWDVDANVNTKEKYIEAVSSFEAYGPDGQPNTIQTDHKRKDGSTFPVEVVSKFRTIDDEEYLISYVKDITRRLQRTEDINFYFELINSSKDMIFLANHENGMVEFANETACKTLGYTLGQLKDMKVSDFRRPFEAIDNIEIPEVFNQIEKENNMTTFGIYETKDGKKISVETNLHLKDYHGKKYVVAVSREIDDRIEIERKKEELNRKLKDYNKTLKKEIALAKEELIEYENVMLRQSKMVAMGEMLENIAHQWRQPLSAVSVLSTGMSLQNDQDLLNKELLGAGLNDINTHVQYLSKTIDDFRNFFKPDKQRNNFMLSSLIKSVIKLSNARFDEKSVEFVYSYEDFELNTYESELVQVIINIINNAKDELEKINTKRYIFIDVFKDDIYYTISIKDNAGGISNSIISRIFEPYFTTKHNYQGTGIGLYMSENIVKHMKGHIDVRNENFEYEGEKFVGACFEIKLPLEF